MCSRGSSRCKFKGPLRAQVHPNGLSDSRRDRFPQSNRLWQLRQPRTLGSTHPFTHLQGRKSVHLRVCESDACRFGSESRIGSSVIKEKKGNGTPSDDQTTNRSMVDDAALHRRTPSHAFSLISTCPRRNNELRRSHGIPQHKGKWRSRHFENDELLLQNSGLFIHQFASSSIPYVPTMVPPIYVDSLLHALVLDSIRFDSIHALLLCC